MGTSVSPCFQAMGALQEAYVVGAVLVDSIRTRVESAYGFSASHYNVMNRFQTLLANSTCAATTCRTTLCSR
jgi:hypothetical protein